MKATPGTINLEILTSDTVWASRHAVRSGQDGRVVVSIPAQRITWVTFCGTRHARFDWGQDRPRDWSRWALVNERFILP